MSINFNEFSTRIEDLLGGKLAEILEIVQHDPGSVRSPFIMLPTPDDVDNSIGEASKMVAITSNEYGKAARLAGMCRAQYKIAEGRYKKKYKSALGIPAKNQDAREAYAQEAAGEEWNQLTIISSLCELAESWEVACRVASESSRKILGAIEKQYDANARATKVSSNSNYTESW